MVLDDRAADRQPHSHSVGLGSSFSYFADGHFTVIEGRLTEFSKVAVGGVSCLRLRLCSLALDLISWLPSGTRDEANSKRVELIVSPRSKGEVIRVASAAAKHRVPIMARGAGTANWGQGIPLKGGIVLDMTKLDKIIRIAERKVRTEPGIIMSDVDLAAQNQGMELRMHPSTRRSATLGGFIAGGHVGIGSCTWGILRDRGNISRLEVVSIEETPRVVELSGSDVNQVHHAYGTNGIITEVEMPLAPAYPWREAIIDFADFMTAARFGVALNASDGIVVKLVSINGWPYPELFTPLKEYLRAGYHTVHVMVADEFGEAFESLVADFRGRVAYQGLEGQGPFGRPLYEFSFGHARFHANRVDPELVANIGIFPHEDLLGSIERVYTRFAELGPFRLDMKRMDGHLTCQGSPLFKFRGAAHMAQLIEQLQEEGVRSANTHTMHVRENGMRPVGVSERDFKRAMDPYSLMNPGKFAAEDVENPNEGAALPTTGWTYQKVG